MSSAALTACFLCAGYIGASPSSPSSPSSCGNGFEGDVSETPNVQGLLKVRPR
jgi:hypothetical protein